MKILFILPYPLEEASTRQRIFQFIPYLETHGFQCDVSCFVDSKFHQIIYKHGRYLLKILHTLRGVQSRMKDLHHAVEYDIVFIHREAFPFGSTFFEKRISQKKPIVYDFDDAIYMMNPAHSSLVPFLRRPEKVATIIKLSRAIIAGNHYLADYAVKYNENVSILPTCIDTDYYKPKQETERKHKHFIVGWIGQRGTLSYLMMIREALVKLARKYDFIIKIIADVNVDLGLKTEFKAWRLRDELEDLQNMDIGIMPLPDEEWTRSKCGYKIIQYMGVGKPVVASPVGVNRDIIKDGVNGFLARNNEEWESKLAALMDDAKLRQIFAQAGRNLIEKEYSLRINAPKLCKILSNL